MLTRSTLEHFLNTTLSSKDFQDYGPNGLQIEGSETIQKIAFAVSATKESIHQAATWNADALVVHHGLFWSFHGVRTLTGPFYQRVAPLIQKKINLFGYHLPLDAHPVVGNAAQVAQRLELQKLEAFGDYKGSPTGVKGLFPKPIAPQDLHDLCQTVLGHQIYHAKGAAEKIQTLGIITGGANGGWLEASKHGLDAYLTGEMSEHDWHDSTEAGVHMFAGGHHATERFGIQALQELVAKNFEVETHFFDSSNPA